MTDEIDHDFMNAGVRNYADAYAAVVEFRERLRDLIELGLREQGGGVWTVPSGEKVKTTRSQVDGLWIGAGSPLEIVGAPDAGVRVDVGLYWDCIHTRTYPVVLCVNMYAGPEVLLSKPTVPEDAGIRHFKSRGGRYFYVVPDTDTPDLKGDVRRLLDGVRATLIASAPKTA